MRENCVVLLVYEKGVVLPPESVLRHALCNFEVVQPGWIKVIPDLTGCILSLL